MQKTFNFLSFIKKYGTLIGFFVIVIVYAAIRPDVFLSWRNIRNILEQSAILAVVSTTVTMVMITGDLDLSVGSTISMSAVVCVDMMAKGLGMVPSILIALLVGLAVGALNGLLVAYGGIPAFVATLATMTAVGGAALYYTNGATLFKGIEDSFLVLGQGFIGPIPVAVFIMLIIAFIGWVVLEHTVFGRRLYAIGGNLKASFLAGINVKTIRLLAFLLSGVGAAFAGVMLSSRLASAHPLSGAPYMLNSAAAVFLGATTFKEGEPNILGTIFGVFFLTVMGNGLNLLRVDSYIQQVLTGLIIVLAVLLSGLTNKGNNK